MAQMFQTLDRVMRSPTDTLKIECGGCARRRTYTRAEAFQTFGAGAAPYDIRRKARCSDCGCCGFATVWI
jgi:hypothetical protein